MKKSYYSLPLFAVAGETVEVVKSPDLSEVALTYKSKTKARDRVAIKSSAEAVEVLRRIWDDNLEHVESFYVVLMNRANHVLGWAKIGLGGIGGVVCDPRIIFQLALTTNASALILAHNHPSGNLLPSQQDKEVTKKMVESGKLLDITVLDHVILTEESFYSFADEGSL